MNKLTHETANFRRLHDDDDEVGFKEFESVLSSHWVNGELEHRTVVDVFASIDLDGNGFICASELDRAISIFETHGHDSPADKLKKHWCLYVCVPVCPCVCPVHARLHLAYAYCRGPFPTANFVNTPDHMLVCLVDPPPQAFAPCPAAASQESHARSSTRPRHAPHSPLQPHTPFTSIIFWQT